MHHIERVGRETVRQLLADGAQLVDPLPPREYEAEHLPGAINIPLQRLNRATVAKLDPARPVIVYCFDRE